MSRASSWLIGVCLGGALACAWYLGHAVFGWPWGWQIGASLVLMLAGATPAFEWFVSLALSARAGWLHPEQAFVGAVLAADDDRPEDLEPEPSPVAASPLVGGYLLDEREAFYYTGLLRLFQHAAAADALTSTALIPAAFTDGKHWQYWTDLAAKSGLCVKANGVTTTLPASRTYAWAVGEIRKGNIIWPDADAPAPQPLPHPFQAGLSYKAEAGKAYKGPQKVARDDDD